MSRIPLMKYTFLEESRTQDALIGFLKSTNLLSMGSKCNQFEKAFSVQQERDESILFNSGGSANLAILQSLKNLGRLSDGDKIGYSALTWSTNVMPIIQLGMEPVAIDCELSTLNVSPNKLKERLEEVDIKALFLTNVLGYTDDINEIKTICEQSDIILIEDNCESLGTILPEGKTGNFGVASSFSFYVAHHMSTIEGGMVCTDDQELAEMLKIVRANGWDRNLSPEQQAKWRSKFNIDDFHSKYTFFDLGFNLRPTEITGFLGLYQLSFLEEAIDKRQANYLQIEKVVNDNSDFLPLNHTHIQRLSTFAIPIVCKSSEIRNKYLKKFAEENIEVRPMIAGNMQKQPFYTKYVSEQYSLDNTNHLHEAGFYSGNYPELSPEEIKRIAKCLTKQDV